MKNELFSTGEKFPEMISNEYPVLSDDELDEITESCRRKFIMKNRISDKNVPDAACDDEETWTISIDRDSKRGTLRRFAAAAALIAVFCGIGLWGISGMSGMKKQTASSGNASDDEFMYILEPKIGERFPVPSLTISGTIYATVNSVEVSDVPYEISYTDGSEEPGLMLDYDISMYCEDDYVLTQESLQRDFVCVTVNVTLESDYAVSRYSVNTVNDTKEEFPLSCFNIRSDMGGENEPPKNSLQYSDRQMLYFYDDEVMLSSVKISDGESVEMQMSTVVPRRIANEKIQSVCVGEIGEPVLPHLCLTTGEGKLDPVVQLGLSQD